MNPHETKTNGQPYYQPYSLTELITSKRFLCIWKGANDWPGLHQDHRRLYFRWVKQDVNTDIDGVSGDGDATDDDDDDDDDTDEDNYDDVWLMSGESSKTSWSNVGGWSYRLCLMPSHINLHKTNFTFPFIEKIKQFKRCHCFESIQQLSARQFSMRSPPPPSGPSEEDSFT